MKRDIRFLVTQSCDFDCFFCHHEGILESTLERLSIEDYLILYELYSDMENWNGVTISGGEPLLYRQIDELCQKLYEKGAKITLVTNGHYLLEKLNVLKYVNQINVSIHSLDENIYSEITGRKNILSSVINNLRIVRNTYPNLIIRINITPTVDNWSFNDLKSFLRLAKEIDASIKLTELFPQTHPQCVSIENIIDSVLSLGYKEVISSFGRARLFCLNNEPDIYVMQCTCSQAKNSANPISFCRETHDLYVTTDGKLPLCRLSNVNIDIFDDLKEENTDILQLKLQLALHRISNHQCERNLISNNV